MLGISCFRTLAVSKLKLQAKQATTSITASPTELERVRDEKSGWFPRGLKRALLVDIELALREIIT